MSDCDRERSAIMPANSSGDCAAPKHSSTGAARGIATFLLLGGAIWAVYGGAIHAPFIFDDTGAILENPSIVKLWPLVDGPPGYGPLNPPATSATLGRPLVNFTLAINYFFGGLDPAGYRIFNMVVHALSAMLLWAIVRRTLQLEYFANRFERAAEPLALLVALIWAVHPLQTETIEYVTQRTEGLMGFFYLATLYASMRYWEAPITARTRWLLLSTATCLSGMACKEVMASAPLMVLLFERTFIAGTFRRALRESWPLYVGLALGWVFRLPLSYWGTNEMAGFGLGVPAHVWWITQAKILWLYLELTFWPWPLVIHYEVPYLTTIGAAWPWLLGVGLLAIGTAVLLWRRAAVGFLGAWLFVILSPTLVVPITTEMAAERRMYLPLVAIVALVIVGGYQLAQWATGPTSPEGHREANGRTLTVLTVSCVVVAVVFGLVSARRLEAYRDALSIWRDAAVHQPDNYLVQTNLGVEWNKLGRPQDAIEPFERALRLRPGYAERHKNLAQALSAVGRQQEAIEHFRRAVELTPDMVEARAGLAVALTSVGQFPEAIEEYQEALRLDPNISTTHNNLGVALMQSERTQEAIEHFNHAVRLDPNYVAAYNNLSRACAGEGRSAEAIEAAQTAARLARSQNQSQVAREIEIWLENYRSSLSEP